MSSYSLSSDMEAGTLSDRVGEQSDLRSLAHGAQREKKRRVRYRNANANLLGQPKVYRWDGEAKEVWNKRNIFKMSNQYGRCRCSFCGPRGYADATNRKLSYDEEIAEAHDNPNNEMCCSQCLASAHETPADAGVFYSYDNKGPSYGSDILSQALNRAVVRFENKELDRLVKAEYDVVSAEESNSSEDDEEFELI